MNDWLHIDFANFHFLRPEWLWLFVPLIIIVAVTLLGNKSKSGWQKVIAQHLRPYVISKGSKAAIMGPLILFVVFATIAIIAASGPTWKKIEIPGAKSEAILLIGLDVSLSMMVEDVSPNRLERAKFKIRDLLDANPGSRVGLFAYSGLAFPVVTPCTDYKLVTHQLESLSPGVMPVQGTQMDKALELAALIFSRSEAPGTLLLITDNVDIEQAAMLRQFADTTAHLIELMTFATLQGGKVPRSRNTFFKENGEFVISRLDQNVLFGLQKHDKINVNSLTLDKEDVENIAAQVKKNLIFQSEDETSEEDWKEMGYSLVWIIALLFVFWFRKGWMIQWCLLIFLFSSCTDKVQKWDDLWYSQDYQAQKVMDEGDFAAASEQYASLPHKGVAYYKAGDYESAIQVFSQDTSAASMYNLGLAYAASGQNELAKDAFLLAQELDPDNQEIKNSIERNQQVIHQIDSMRSANPENAIALEEEEKKGELNEREARSEDEELSSDTEAKELPKDGDRITDTMETEMRTAEEMEKPPEDFTPQKGEAAQNVLLREISADPSEFLKRRFKYQYEKYYPNSPKPEKSW